MRDDAPRPACPAAFSPRPFRPAWWLRGAHAQTVGGKLLRPRPAIALRRERLETPDGDFVDLDVGPAPGEHAPVVLVMHGLEGSSRRPYALVTYRELLSRGIRPVGMNFRSCSGEPNRTARFYHSGETDDARLVLRYLGEQFPGARLGAVGYSLGGNALLKLLGEDGEAAVLGAAVAVSVPFDLAAGALALERGAMARVYSEYFLRNLRRKTEAKAALLGGLCDLDAIRRARTLRAFDEAATAPLHGFADADDYYGRSSAAAFLDRIRVPTLLLQAEDDPFLPAASLPREAVARNPCLTAGFTRRGGHVRFVGGRFPWSPKFWAEEEAGRFLAARLGS